MPGRYQDTSGQLSCKPCAIGSVGSLPSSFLAFLSHYALVAAVVPLCAGKRRAIRDRSGARSAPPAASQPTPTRHERQSLEGDACWLTSPPCLCSRVYRRRVICARPASTRQSASPHASVRDSTEPCCFLLRPSHMLIWSIGLLNGRVLQGQVHGFARPGQLHQVRSRHVQQRHRSHCGACCSFSVRAIVPC